MPDSADYPDHEGNLQDNAVITTEIAVMREGITRGSNSQNAEAGWKQKAPAS